MSIPIDKLSLLGSLVPLRQQHDKNDVMEGSIFAVKLDKALGNGENSAPDGIEKAREVAESLTLQMMQSSIDLAGNSTQENSVGSSSAQFSSVNSFLQAYRANISTARELTDFASGLPTQLQELAEAVPPDASSGSPLLRPHGDSAWLEPIISKASQKYGVDVGLIRAVIQTESDFNPQAVSQVGASGLMQLMPATARSLGVSDPFDPEQNVMAGTRFLKDMLQRYDGNVDAALAAYNWGPGNVDRRPDHLPRETRDYLARVKALYTSYNG